MSVLSGIDRLSPAVALVACLVLGGAPGARSDDLPHSIAAARALEASDALPMTSFYAPPTPLPPSPPGTLIRQQAFHGYTLPPGASAVRILYVSRRADGSATAASGVVLIPAGRPPAGGWPVIAWAHGTSGVARQCAPSLMKDVEYGSEGLMPMVAAGYAVVATDYAGLGTPGPHQYEDKIAQANDVVYSVTAARRAVPALGPRWVAIGHSQGGTAVWGVAEMEHRLRDPGYLGGISVAGEIDFALDPDNNPRVIDPANAMYWIYYAYAVKATHPPFDAREMLTPAAMSVYHKVTTEGCWYYGYAVMEALGRRQIFRDGWTRLKAVKAWFDDSRSGDEPIRGPLLVLAGEDDRSQPFSAIQRGVERACRHGLPIEFRHPKGLDHDALMDKMTPAMLAWVRDRLQRRPWQSSCRAAMQSPPR